MIHPQTFGYFCREAMINFKRAGVITYASIGVITVTLFIMGIFLLLIVNLRLVQDALIKKASIIVYLKDNLPNETVQSIQTNISKQVNQASQIIYVSKQDALEGFKKELSQYKDILSGVSGNPLPSYFEIKLTPSSRFSWEKLKNIAIVIEGMEGIEGVNYGQKAVEAIGMITDIVRMFIVGIGFIMGLATLIIISNTIELALFARQEEIEIMKLVGATPWFIRCPYLLEGMIHGLISGILSIGLLFLIYHFGLLKTFATNPIFLFLPQIKFISWQMMGVLIASSGFLGCLGSLLSLHYFLKSNRE
jgi:cell division transport system permease protein